MLPETRGEMLPPGEFVDHLGRTPVPMSTSAGAPPPMSELPPRQTAGSVPPSRRPLSARQRAVYRRRRIGAALVALALLSLLVLGAQAVPTLIAGVASPAEAVVPAAPQAAAESPVQLGMPVTGSSLPLSGREVDERGLLDPPAGEAVWLTGHDRVTPGQLGTAVIAGRASGEDGEPTAFSGVTTLTEGDRVVVTFGDGVTLELDVVSTAVVDRGGLESSDLLWGDQRQTRRVALVTSDEVAGADGDSHGSFVAVAELG